LSLIERIADLLRRLGADSIPLLFLIVAFRDLPLAFLGWLVASPAGAYWFTRFDRIAVALLLFVLLYRSTPSKLRLRGRVFECCYGAFCLVAGLNLLFLSQLRQYAFRTWFSGLVLPFGVYLLARELVNEQVWWQRARVALLCLALLVGGSALVEEFAGWDILARPQGLRPVYPGSEWLRVNGPYGYAESLGLISAMLFFLLLSGAREKSLSRKAHALHVLACVLLAAACIFSFFRVCWLALAAGLILWIWFTGSVWLRRAVVVAALLLLLALGLSYPWLRQSTFFQERVANPTNVYHRIATYRAGWKLVAERPWSGVGFLNFPQAIQRQELVRFRSGHATDHPHNTYLQFAAELGLGAAVLYLVAMLALLFSALRLSRRLSDRKRAMSLVLPLLIYLGVNATLSLATDMHINQLFFFVAGVIVSLEKRPR